MQRLKIYLRSRWERAYRMAAFASGVLLLVNAFHQFDLEQGAIPGFIANVGTAMVILLFTTIGRPLAHYLVRPDAILLLGAAGVLIWNADMALGEIRSLWFENMLWAGVGLGIIGVSEPVFNQRLSLTLSPNRIRLQQSLFSMKKIPWSEVDNLEMGEKTLEIGLHSGRTYRLRPLQSDVQHLRHHLHEAWIRAQKQAG